MDKQQVIDILEYFRPSRDKYCLSPVDDYVDDMIDSCIDNIIEFVKREPDNEWIKRSEKLPKCHEEVLVCNDYGDISTAMLLESETEWFSKNKYYNLKTFTHWMPLPEPPEVEQ